MPNATKFAKKRFYLWTVFTVLAALLCGLMSWWYIGVLYFGVKSMRYWDVLAYGK